MASRQTQLSIHNLRASSHEFEGEIHERPECGSTLKTATLNGYSIYLLLRKCVCCCQYNDKTSLHINDINQFPHDGVRISTDPDLRIIGQLQYTCSGQNYILVLKRESSPRNKTKSASYQY